MVQRVPAHLGESTRESVSPWIMIAGIILLLIVACAVIFMLLGGTSRLGLGIGATATPTRTRTPTIGVPTLPITLPAATSPAPGPTAATIKYKVKPGDNLTTIAARYKVMIQAIMTANGMKDDTIRVGEEIIIPLPTPTPQPGAQPLSPPGTTPTPISFQSPPTAATPAGTPGVIRYTVQRGDSLISIAASNGSTIDAIRAANQMDSDFLSIGQVLLVPVGAWTPSPTQVPVTTATPTAQFAYAAPNLIAPSDGKPFHGSADTPQLMWVAPATLKLNEFYVVHLDYTWGSEKKSIVRQVKQGTSIRLDATDYPGTNVNGTQFTWYVVIVSQTTPKAPSQTTQMSAQSPVSPTWTFVWY